jgi:uncharacterized protein YggT (Ycf19 family)
MVSRPAARDHQVRVTTDHPVRPHTTAMDRSTSTAPVAGARLARALTYLVYAFVLVSLIMLLFGFFLLLFGANPDAAFAEWVYRTLTRVMAPFRGLFEPLPLDGRSVLDVSILFAMIVYGVAALLLHALIDWLTDRIAETGYAR